MIRRIRNYPALLWFGAALAITVGLVQFTDNLLDHPSTQAFDLMALRKVAEFRSPVLTNVFVNWTALGSTTLVTLHTIIALVFLISAADRAGALQLVAASVGSTLLTDVAKEWIERPRPTAVPVLVEVTGFSYPSGHSLAAAAVYVTIAFLVWRHLPTSRQRVLVPVLAVIVVGGVGLSRIYLGAHYATDVISGIGLGTAWALTLAGLFSMREQRARFRERA